MKYILQICTGSWHSANYPADDIIRKIGKIASRIPVDRIIFGWNTDAELYKKVGGFLHGKGIKMLLWLPVFSEISGISEPDGTLDLWGSPVVPPALQAGEDFTFCCPSSRRNRRIVKEIYEQYFADCGFDGVFLDKIRGQSFVSGVPGVLSCGCERCRQAYLKKGVDVDAVRALYEHRADALFNMAYSPMNGEFVLEDTRAQRFFTAKEEIIADAVAEICAYFREKGMIVGLDLFAPVISRFVGQNYALMTRYADFIKPMLYRKTEAPAGIGYEYALFEKRVPGARGRTGISMDKAFLDTQLEAIRRVSCEKFPGIEINYREDIARTDPGYITESLAAIHGCGFEGAALCWDVMLAPEAHIEAISNLESKGHTG
ncbi:MAG: hypothetical protein IK127_05905 [Clostridia bacterium]|nr:hypothetical protein [Clostridia bacterium]